MTTQETKVCKTCQIEKPIDEFGLITPQKYRRGVCRSCEFKTRKNNNPETYRAKVLSQLKWHAESRKKPHKRASILRGDMRAMDRRKGWEKSDLTVEWIDHQISKPCPYCKQRLDKTEMTLDRIDNTVGHTKENLVPCCKMCNYFRRDMPYEAWLVLAQNMPKIVKLGMLKGWSAGAGFRGKRKEINDEKQGI